MRIPIALKEKGEGLDKPADAHIWAMLHIEMACPQCGKLFKPSEGTGLAAVSVQPLTILQPIKCPNCSTEFHIKNSECWVEEDPLPPLSSNQCFGCNTPINVAGWPPYYTGNVPGLCRNCMDGVVRNDQTVLTAIVKKANDYGLRIRFG